QMNLIPQLIPAVLKSGSNRAPILGHHQGAQRLAVRPESRDRLFYRGFSGQTMLFWLSPHRACIACWPSIASGRGETLRLSGGARSPGLIPRASAYRVHGFILIEAFQMKIPMKLLARTL